MRHRRDLWAGLLGVTEGGKGGEGLSGEENHGGGSKKLAELWG